MSNMDRVRNWAKKQQEKTGPGKWNTYLKLPEGVELFKAKGKETLFDVIPYRVTVDDNPDAPKGETFFCKTFFVHENVGPERKQVLCPSTFGRACPICEEHSRLRSSGDKELSAKMNKRERMIMNIIDRKGNADKIVIYDTKCYGMFGDMLVEAIEIAENDNGISFDDPREGRAVRTRWEEKPMGDGGKYWKPTRIDFVERGKDGGRTAYNPKVVDKAVDLDNVLVELGYKELKAMLATGAAPEEEEDEIPYGDAPRKRPAAAAEQEDNLDDLDGGDNGLDDDVPHEKSTKKKVSAPMKKVASDLDSLDDDNEDTDEEKDEDENSGDAFDGLDDGLGLPDDEDEEPAAPARKPSVPVKKNMQQDATRRRRN